MFCKYCGANLKDDSTAFCPSCGKRLNLNQANENTTSTSFNDSIEDTANVQGDTVVNAKPKNKPTAKKIIIIVASILLACGVVEAGIYFGYKAYNKHTINKYISYVKDNNYLSANELYYGKLDSNNQYVSDIIKELNQYLYSIKDDMYNNNKSYEECVENLNTVNSLGIEYLSDSILDANSYINEVNQNNSYISQADECFNSNDYINAIKIYSMVTENTCNYSNVQDKISQSENLLVEQTKEYSQELIEQQNYNEAINLINAVSTVIENNSELDNTFNTIKDDYKQYFIDTCLDDAKTSVSSKNEDTMLEYLKSLYNGINLYDNILSEKNVQNANKTIIDGISSKINDYIKKSNVDDAMSLLKRALEILPEDQSTSFDDIQAQIVELIDKNSQEYISKNKDYSGALEYLKGIYESNPENDDIRKLYEKMGSKQCTFESVWSGTVSTASKDGVTLRESASTGSKEVTHINDNEKVSVSEEFGDWYKVNYSGYVGYVLKDYVKNYG